jgi:uncharacterized protein
MEPSDLRSQQFPTNPTSAPTLETTAWTRRLQWPFWGPNGFRAFWRFLIFVALVMGLRLGLARLFHMPREITNFTPQDVLMQEGLSVLIVLAVTLFMGVFEKRSLGAYGLPLRGAFGARFFEGLVWGFLAQGATMVILSLTGNATFQGFDQRGSSALYFGVLWVCAFLLVGFFEELLFRGYPQFTLATGIGFWPAAIVLSAVFWVAHMFNPGETWVGGVSVALYAIAMCISLRLTGSLWFAIGMHAAGDWTETYFFGVADSGMQARGHLLNTALTGNKWMTGGTVGPEASVVDLLVLIVVIALLLARFRPRVEKRLTAPLS